MICVRLFHISGIRLTHLGKQNEIESKEEKDARTKKIDNVASEIQARIEIIAPSRKHKRRVQGSIAPIEIELEEKYINSMAALYADTWIEEVGLHTLNYSTTTRGERPTFGIGGGKDNNNKRSVKTKRISGDVSGVIGEVLFASILSKHYKIDEKAYAHLSSPNNMRYPDFLIVSHSEKFREEAKMRGNFSEGFPIPCEVKTFSNFANNSLDRIRHAADQLLSYWRKNQEQGIGIICIPILNTANNAYDMFFVWCS